MSEPHGREARPSRPYGGESGGRPGGRDTRGPGSRRRAGDGRGSGDDATTGGRPARADLTRSAGRQPTFTPHPDGAPRRAADGPGRPRGRRAEVRSREPGGWLSRIWQGSLHGGLGICVIVGSAVIGAIATIVTKAQPGMALDLSVLAGTVAAALTVQPRTGRLIFPVPALSYLIAALAAGVAYNRSLDKTALAVGAAQWIANGFFVMVLATLLAIALTTVRWFMWRRGRRGPSAPDRSGQPGPSAGPPRRPRAPQGTQPAGWPPGSAGSWDQRSAPRPGTGPYNFSSGA
jgi:hypothetical protein